VAFLTVNMLMLLSLLVVCAFALDEETRYRGAFEEYKIAYGKVYESDVEHDQRFQVFKSNLNFINNFPFEERGFTVGINEFADLTNTEFRARMNGLRINITKKPEHSFLPRLKLKPTVPATWDWRAKGVVTKVKNQGQCGSCWSFSATGSMEGAWVISGQKLTSLSEQNLIDCSTAQGNEGCNGGLMDQAFQYVISNHGIDTEASYPYTATGPNQCEFTRNHVGSIIQGFHDVKSGSESELLEATYQQPTSVAIDASHMSFQFYNGGVYNEPACSSTQLDHGVLSIGFGSLQGKDYWLVKNSWGASWGLQGYIMMSRNKNNQCGIATAASYPCIHKCK